MSDFKLMEGLQPGTPFQMTSSDVAQKIAADVINDATIEPSAIKGCVITIEDFNLRVTVGGDSYVPTTDATTKIGDKVVAGGSIKLENFGDCRDFRFISAVAGSHALLQITPYYDASGK